MPVQGPILTKEDRETTMKAMKYFTPGVLLLVLSACGTTQAKDPKSLVEVAKDNIERAKKYHDLAAKAKIAQAEVQSYVAEWIKACDATSKTLGATLSLQMGPDGDPGCQAPTTPAPQPQTAAPISPNSPNAVTAPAQVPHK